MRALTSSEVLVADQLFATLDTTTRALQPETDPLGDREDERRKHDHQDAEAVGDVVDG